MTRFTGLVRRLCSNQMALQESMVDSGQGNDLMKRSATLLSLINVKELTAISI